MSGRARLNWPDGHRAAFAVFDDTDLSTLETAPLVYDLLGDLGLRVTKSVWPIAATRPQLVEGSTLDQPDYLEWVLGLQESGHEIGFHNATFHSSLRDDTIRALDRFEEVFGHAPKVGADHAGNVEALYWGAQRMTGWRRRAYAVAQRIMRPNRPAFSGADPSSPFFWGDVCRDRIVYWRNFCFDEVDLLRISPKLPYHDPRRSYVNYWFTSTDGSNLSRFVRHLSDEKLDRLELHGGVCIMYTHFGLDFVDDGRLAPEFVEAMTRLADRRIWVAPVGEVLDHLRAALPDMMLTDRERRALELRWMFDRLVDSGFVRKRMWL